MQRINAKDMINRYIIAGIKTIIRLGREKDIYDVLFLLSRPNLSRNWRERSRNLGRGFCNSWMLWMGFRREGMAVLRSWLTPMNTGES